jgi:hypothetical protein
MIPSIVARWSGKPLHYLRTTFALADPSFEQACSIFNSDEGFC